MSQPLSPQTEARLQLAMDLGERAICLIMFAGFVLRLSASLILRPYNMLALFSEGLIVIFILFRRRAQAVTTRPLDWIFALLGTTLPLLIDANGKPFAPPVIGLALMFAGMMFSIWAKLSLRLSFGLAAANRGVVATGPYRFVRHPMYAGYAAVYLGFWLNNPSLTNSLIYVAAIFFQVLRILAEEKVLGQDPAYRAMMANVRWRLAPGLF